MLNVMKAFEEFLEQFASFLLFLLGCFILAVGMSVRVVAGVFLSFQGRGIPPIDAIPFIVPGVCFLGSIAASLIWKNEKPS